MTLDKEVSSWVNKTLDKIDTVRTDAIKDLVTKMSTDRDSGGYVPIKTGALRDSLIVEEASNGTIIGYTVPYARRVNYGFVGTDSLGRKYNQPGQHFLDQVVADWETIVNDYVKKHK